MNTSTTPFIDTLESIKGLDEDNMLGGIESFADQVRHAWEESSKVQLNPEAITSIVVAGMGGSGLGADLAKSVFNDVLKKPLTLVQNYDLPGYVNETTLVILASFSGTTEEILSTAEQAQQKNAQIAVITAGGPLLEMATAKNWPHYVINPTQNPSKQQRIALGYAIVGMLGLLTAAGCFSLTSQEIEEVFTTILDVDQRCQVTSPTDGNPAKTLAFSLVLKRPTLIVADFLAGAAHIAQNQLHENAKVFASFFCVPELNHHLMEGLQFPTSNTHDQVFVLFQSQLYHPQNMKRIELTGEVVDTNGIEILEVTLKGETRLTQAFEMITLMSYVSFYLAMLEQIHPAPLPNVDWFKTELKNR